MNIKSILLAVSSLSVLAGESTPVFSASRPGNANPSSTLSKGHFMLEASSDVASDDFDSYLQLRYGLHHRAELYIVQPVNDITNQSLGAVSIAFTLANEQGFIPEIGAHFSINNPTNFSNDIDISIPFSHSLPQGFNIGGQFGPDFGSDNISYTIYLGKSISDKLWSFVEIYNDSGLMFDTGLTYMIKDNIQLDTNLGLSLDGNDDETFINFGIAWMFPF